MWKKLKQAPTSSRWSFAGKGSKGEYWRSNNGVLFAKSLNGDWFRWQPVEAKKK